MKIYIQPRGIDFEFYPEYLKKKTLFKFQKYISIKEM